MSSGVEWDEESYDFSDLSKPLNRGWEYSVVQHQYRFVEGANELPRAYAPGEKYHSRVARGNHNEAAHDAIL
jgi:hypothetical protein